ncbi:hypothetical protein FOZ60_008327 [Perkinsus olseni]|uniref:Uncharacterized protein n=1 Tax=Perkinsus olseni TaxID=32597 RepID=A0A7J6NKT0_PEROL|nr:hypothetical protein FOZ60_008327 [Perkinsus olseni]
MVFFGLSVSILSFALSSAMTLRTAFDLDREVKNIHSGCQARYIDSLLSVFIPSWHGGKEIYWQDSETGTSVSYWKNEEKSAKIEFVKQGGVSQKVEGRSEVIEREFKEVLPFGHLIDTVLPRVYFGVTHDECVALINAIENTPPERYQKGRSWIKKFVGKKMDKALSLAAKHETGKKSI